MRQLSLWPCVDLNPNCHFVEIPLFVPPLPVMALSISLLRNSLVLFFFFHVSISKPVLQPSNTAALYQTTSPTVLASFYVSPTPSVSNSTDATSSTSTEFRVETQVHNTYMTIQAGGKYRRMPEGLTSRLLDDAYQDVRHQAIHFGGDTPLEKVYEIRYQGLTLAAFNHGSPRETTYKVTYSMVIDLIIGLRLNLERLNGVECFVDLFKVTNGRRYPAGIGVLGFSDETIAMVESNAMVAATSSNNTSLRTLLGATDWSEHIPGTNVLVTITNYQRGSRMPLAQTFQLLKLAKERIAADIRAHDANTDLPDHEYHVEFQDVRFEVYRRRGMSSEMTYGLVQNMVTVLQEGFWHVNYKESMIDIVRLPHRTLLGTGRIYIHGEPGNLASNLMLSGVGAAGGSNTTATDLG